MSQPPRKPDLRTAPVQVKPSEWSARSVPKPAPGRSTADPRTPKLSELRARGEQLASLVADRTLAAGAGAAVPVATARPPALPPNPTRAQCEAAWARVQQRTERVLNAGNAATSRPQQKLDRNRAISAAYAELAEGDARMRWAGIASVVSTQAQCAMEDANTAVNRGDAARDAVAYMPGINGAAARQATRYVYDSAVEVQRALYDTNEEIFSDIYPAVAMYKAEGIRGILPRRDGGCGDERPDRQMPLPVQQALRRIDRGGEENIRAGSRVLADYEQTEIVQGRIYDDPNRPLLRQAMQLNQVVSDVPVAREVANLVMKAQQPEVAISTQCGGGAPVSFPGDITVARDRVNYYDRLVAEYMRRDPGARDAMSRVIQSRDPLRGGPDYGPPRQRPGFLRW